MVEIIHVGNTLRKKGPSRPTGMRAPVVPIRRDWIMQRRMVDVRRKIILQQLSVCAVVLERRTRKGFSFIEDMFSATAGALFGVAAPPLSIMIWCFDKMKGRETHKLPRQKPLRPVSLSDGIGRIRGIDAEY